MKGRAPSLPVRTRLAYRAEELLYCLILGLDRTGPLFFRPMDPAFERWAGKSGGLRGMQRFQKRGLLEVSLVDKRRVVRLTSEGVSIALGGTDPETLWAAPWDGKWRLALFDVPETERTLRQQLRATLAAGRFGCLQGSVWISPHPVDTIRAALSGITPDPNSLVFLESTPASGESPQSIVRSAWDFDEINRRYKSLQQILLRAPDHPPASDQDWEALQAWGRAECEAWRAANRIDPLLPDELLPVGYLGKVAWRQRRETLRQILPPQAHANS